MTRIDAVDELCLAGKAFAEMSDLHSFFTEQVEEKKIAEREEIGLAWPRRFSN